jgi:transposase-like protein
MKSEFPETLMEAVTYFSVEDNAFEFMKGIRWPDGKVNCPRCGCEKVSFIKTRKLWTCSACKTKKQFTIKVGTILEDSPISYGKWICAFWLIANAKNGVSSYEIGRSLGVTQRTGWFMLQRIRLAMQAGSILKTKMGGVVEVDESYIGGKARNMHQNTKARRGINGTGMAGKTAVMGLLERHGPDKVSRIVAEVLPATPTKKALIGRVKKYVLEQSQVHTDALNSYTDLKHSFEHKFVDHAECYVKGNVHTNGLENFWSLLKRSLKGTYVSVEPFHLFRYLDEQVFRFNERKNVTGDQGRFIKAIAGVIGKRLTWKQLTDADSDGLPQAA